MFLVYEKNYLNSGDVDCTEETDMSLFHQKENALNELNRRKEYYEKESNNFTFMKDESSDTCIVFAENLSENSYDRNGEFHSCLTELTINDNLPKPTFRNITEKSNTQEIEQRNLYRAKTIQNDTNQQEPPKWIIGNLQIERTLIELTSKVRTTYRIQPVNYTQAFAPFIQTDTLCSYSNITDVNNIPIWEHDIVEFLGQIGTIVYEAGCFGIAFKEPIDWDNISEKIPKITGCQNHLYACCNDNFISLWEIYWNFNEIDNTLTTVKVIGNTFDNPELLA